MWKDSEAEIYRSQASLIPRIRGASLFGKKTHKHGWAIDNL